MGISNTIGDNMRSNMQKQMAFQTELILKQRQMQMATQVAMSRQRFHYYCTFYLLLVPLCLIAFIKTHKPTSLIPIIPTSFVCAFQYDLSYGSMLNRVRDVTDKLLVQDANKFYIPSNSGIVSIKQYERILKLKNGIKIQESS